MDKYKKAEKIEKSVHTIAPKASKKFKEADKNQSEKKISNVVVQTKTKKKEFYEPKQQSKMKISYLGKSKIKENKDDATDKTSKVKVTRRFLPKTYKTPGGYKTK